MASSSSISCEKYEVFISFRGKDIRFGFLSHIHKALLDNKIRTFVDDQLERGEQISSSLLETIERCAISVVIFSENYTNSPWCLDELVKILDCKKTMGQIVIPVFYLVKPDDVQELTGSFGKAISEHKQNINLSHKVENWCNALMETTLLSGFDSKEYLSEFKLIEEIIKDIQEKLNHLFRNDCSYNDGLVGIDSRVENVKLLLCCEDVSVIGIWGVGGIGKTTIAQKVFNQICGEFESHCFMENVTKKFENCPESIHNELLSKLLGKDVFDIVNSVMTLSSIRRRLSRMKVLIVLDDVSDFDQIKSIMHAHYHSGSRIIVTSRDRQLLVNVDAKIYKVEELNKPEALQLFCSLAFKQNILEKGLVELSEKAVESAGGFPLALQVLGCNLRSKSVEEWKDELENLKDKADDKVHKILRRSYDGLSLYEKEIFLDIACFFKGKDRDYIESILTAKDISDRATKVSGSKIGISRLVDRSLISISSTNCVDMHDLIQQMGKKIEHDVQKIKRRRRVWKPSEIVRLLTKEEGSDAIKGLSLDMSQIKDIKLSPKAFEKMDNLKYLIFYNLSYNNEIRVYLPEGLEFLSEELRCLCWYHYPLKSLPKSFCSENLVELRMPYSHLEELWNGVQNLVNLKYIDLTYSKLIKIPDLSRALNLEVLNLNFSQSLIEIPSSLKYLTKLIDLSLWYCTSLSHLPSCLHLISLKSLQLPACKELTMIPKIPCYERHPGNAIEKVSSYMGSQFQLRKLDLSYCSRLECLPDSICNLIYLVELDISGCENLRELPKNLGNLKFLEELFAIESGINRMPDSFCNLKNLQELDVGDCVSLYGLPQNMGNLESLKKLLAYGSGIKELLPSSINDLRELIRLDLKRCKGLKLPMWTGNFPLLVDVDLSFCGISEFPSSLCSVTSLQRLNLSGNNFESIPKCINHVYRLEYVYFRDCMRLKYISDIIFYRLSQMYEVDFGNCINLDQRQLHKMTDFMLTRGLNWFTSSGSLVLCIPGSEVPGGMMYQNNNGSCLSFSFKLQEHTHFPWFYACAVLDPQVCEFYCDVKNVLYDVDIIDESGSSICSEKGAQHFFLSHAADEALRSTHMLLWRCAVDGKDLIVGNKYTIVFKFYTERVINCSTTYKICRRSETIIKCGVHPLFDFDDGLID